VPIEDEAGTVSPSAPSVPVNTNALSSHVPGGNSGPEQGKEGPDPASTALRVECERLRQVVRQLQEQHEQDSQTIAGLQAERDAYLRQLHAWAWAQVLPEELQRWADEEEENGVSFSQVLEALDQRKEP
jgi:hypothetical protein